MKRQAIRKKCFWGLILASVISILSGCSMPNEGTDKNAEIEADSDYIYDGLNEDEKALFDQITETDDPRSGIFRLHTMNGLMLRMGPKCVRDTVGEQ